MYHSALILLKEIKAGTKQGDDNLRSLLEKHGSFEAIFTDKIKGTLEDKIAEHDSLKKAKKKIENFKKDFSIVTINDRQFPEKLNSMRGTTPVLYFQGDISLAEKKTIAVVGTRELKDEEDITEGKKIMQRLINKDYVIVSGLARGCDTLANTYAVNNSGKTIAVLGTTLDEHYPRENKDLQDRISKEHLLVSQYPVGIKTFPSYFAHRNRTLVGLSSDGVIVILSSDKSGTQHAIRLCIEQGKTLYALRRNFLQASKEKTV